MSGPIIANGSPRVHRYRSASWIVTRVMGSSHAAGSGVGQAFRSLYDFFVGLGGRVPIHSQERSIHWVSAWVSARRVAGTEE